MVFQLQTMFICHWKVWSLNGSTWMSDMGCILEHQEFLSWRGFLNHISNEAKYIGNAFLDAFWYISRWLQASGNDLLLVIVYVRRIGSKRIIINKEKRSSWGDLKWWRIWMLEESPSNVTTRDMCGWKVSMGSGKFQGFFNQQFLFSFKTFKHWTKKR